MSSEYMDLRKLTPVSWYARIGEEVIEGNFITGEVTSRPFIEEGEDEE